MNIPKPSFKPARKWRWIACLTAFVAALTATVLGCGWPGTDHSVRFNDYRSEKEFGRLPPLPNSGNPVEDKLFSWDEEVGYNPDIYEQQENFVAETNQLWEDSLAVAQEGRLHKVGEMLRDYLKRTEDPSLEHRYGLKDRQKRRNSAMDKLDALSALDQGSSVESVRAYLEARAAYDEGRTAGVVEFPLNNILRDKNLADNASYLIAALRYRDENRLDAKYFHQLAKNYPKSEKREAALFMYAVATMKESKSYEQAKKFGGRSLACSECRDEEWQKARAGFERLLREYPRGRYAADARGWLAYLSLGVGDRAGALVEY
ncbi:MAG TPA: outer membrane protein assembly factor BamD, partial [Blastocatellia bacterium]|nr:outer membrane protein assembly factor BamD [Blastocatellia bacterium]